MKPEKKAKNVKAKNEKIPKKKGNSTLIIGVVAVIVIIGAIYFITKPSSGLTSQIEQTAKQGLQSDNLQDSKLLLNKIEELAKQGKQSGSSQEVPIFTQIELLAAQGKQSDNPQELKTILSQIELIAKQSSQQKEEIKLPSYAYTNPVTLKAYRYATEHPDLLEQIPCYCGCGGHSGHRFLRDCYIHDDWTYDEHASFCDVCIGEAIKLQDYLASGKTLKEARALIDEEYTKKGGDRTNTPPVSDYYTAILTPKLSGIPAPVSTPRQVDLSGSILPDNFKSIADGLKLTPAGANRAYFVNTKLITGTEIEAPLLQGSVEPDGFYGKRIIGMFSADFTATSWIELHDLGYDSTKDTTIRVHAEQGMKNIVNTRPLVYGHIQNVDNVFKLMKDPTSMATSYQIYKPVLDAVDYQNSAYALVMALSSKFSNMSYEGMTPVNGKIELVQAYNLTDSKSVPAALNKYNPEIKGNILIIKVTGDLTTVNKEKDNIDAAAR